MQIRPDVNGYMRELRAWLDETEDVPLEDMRDFFTARVGSYEAHMALWAKAYARMAELVPAECKTLLDLGCGTGLELDAIYARLPHLRVTGVDLCEAMLAQLARKHADRQPTLLCADYFAAELGEDAFDAAVSFETLHHFTQEKKRGLFAKIHRALHTGGVYIQADYIACCDEEETLLFEACARKRTRAGIAADAFVHFDTPLTLEHEMQALREAGFMRIEAVEAIEGATILRAWKE